MHEALPPMKGRHKVRYQQLITATSARSLLTDVSLVFACSYGSELSAHHSVAMGWRWGSLSSRLKSFYGFSWSIRRYGRCYEFSLNQSATLRSVVQFRLDNRMRNLPKLEVDFLLTSLSVCWWKDEAWLVSINNCLSIYMWHNQVRRRCLNAEWTSLKHPLNQSQCRRLDTDRHTLTFSFNTHTPSCRLQPQYLHAMTPYHNPTK